LILHIRIDKTLNQMSTILLQQILKIKVVIKLNFGLGRVCVCG